MKAKLILLLFLLPIKRKTFRMFITRAAISSMWMGTLNTKNI